MAQATKEAQRRRQRGLVDLARARLRRSGGGRAASVLRVVLFVGFASAILLVRESDGGDVPLAGLVSVAARLGVWILGAPLALAAAKDHEALDQRDGIAALVASRGIGARALAAARILGAMLEIALSLGIPLIALAALTAAVASSLTLAVARLGLVVQVAVFAAIAGVTLGGISAACGRLGRSRGRLLLVAVILLPWMLADVTGHRSFSIPGALAAALDFTFGGQGA